jgi:hypothetical protein
MTTHLSFDREAIHFADFLTIDSIQGKKKGMIEVVSKK